MRNFRIVKTTRTFLRFTVQERFMLFWLIPIWFNCDDTYPFTNSFMSISDAEDFIKRIIKGNQVVEKYEFEDNPNPSKL